MHFITNIKNHPFLKRCVAIANDATKVNVILKPRAATEEEVSQDFLEGKKRYCRPSSQVYSSLFVEKTTDLGEWWGVFNKKMKEYDQILESSAQNQ